MNDAYSSSEDDDFDSCAGFDASIRAESCRRIGDLIGAVRMDNAAAPFDRRAGLASAETDRIADDQ